MPLIAVESSHTLTMLQVGLQPMMMSPSSSKIGLYCSGRLYEYAVSAGASELNIWDDFGVLSVCQRYCSQW
jgi:hypothetical protein